MTAYARATAELIIGLAAGLVFLLAIVGIWGPA